MRDFELDEKDPLKIWIRESGAENPKPGFHQIILNKLSTQPSVKPYEPVISIFAMKLIGGILAVFVIGVLLFIPASESSLSFWNQLPEYSLPSINITLPAFVIPNVELGAVFNISIIIFSFLSFCVAVLASKKLRYQ